MSLSIYGEIARDILVYPNSKINRRWGGAGLYASLAASKQGLNPTFLTLCGPELQDEYSFSYWKQMGISFDYAKHIENYNHPKYLVTGFEKYQYKISRPMTTVKIGYDYRPKIPNGTKGILIFPIDHTLPKYLCVEGKKNGIKIFLDPKPNEHSISEAKELLQYCDVLLVNEDEIKLLSESTSLTNAINKVISAGTEYVVVKRGDRGCIVTSNNHSSFTVPSFHSNVVCTLGSGDVFGGALASTFLRTNDIKYSVIIASCVAANFIEKLDAEAIISRENVEVDINTREVIDIPEDINKTIYLAGPFFSEQELSWVNKVCNILESSGFRVLSPSRENGILKQNASLEDKRRIFEADIELIKKSDIVVALLDHDDPGTCFEIGYSYYKGVYIIGLSTSNRILNNMILNGCNIICDSINHLVGELYAYLR